MNLHKLITWPLLHKKNLTYAELVTHPQNFRPNTGPNYYYCRH